MKGPHAIGRHDFLRGHGVLKEWKTYDFEAAMGMLEEMRRFEGWKVGYLSYEFGMKHEGVVTRHAGGEDFSRTPLLHFIAPEEVKVSHDVPKVADGDGDGGNGGGGDGPRFFSASPPRPQLSREDYDAAIAGIHRLLRAGETYQVNFSYPFHGTFEGDLWTFFQRLYDINPSPHACFLDFAALGGVSVVSNSPERLLCGRRSDDGGMWVETKPIKGTAPLGGSGRGRTTSDPRAVLSTQKHAAELDMIVDLARNDLGKVCQPGTVHVADHRAVEVYSHVAHTVSTVRGKLNEGLDWVDALLAVFPGGSVTGAPKKRTMEIIDRLEGSARGIYTGSAGYVTPDGEFDFNILIRSVVFCEGRYVFNSGGGILVDSTAQSEYEETLHKAAAIKASLLLVSV